MYNNFSVPVTLTGTSLGQHRDMTVIVTCLKLDPGILNHNPENEYFHLQWENSQYHS